MNYKLLVVLIFLSIIIKAQDTLNQTDVAGKKQGHWIKYDDNKKKLYEGTFLNDIPVGKFTYFYDTGIPWAMSVFSKNGKVNYVKHFGAGGKLTGEGKYVDEKKDSLWRFYDDDEKLLSEEFYIDGIKNGRAKVYYVNGKVCEDKMWKNGKLNGLSKKYFESGEIKHSCNYVDDKVEGKVVYYQALGKVLAEGAYKNDLKTGKWTFYNEDGTVKRVDVYVNGKKTGVDKDIITKEQEDAEREKYKDYKIEDPSQENYSPH
ncbi:MAG: hypothetical protein ABI315_08040 [Bacteroidia bacterium]